MTMTHRTPTSPSASRSTLRGARHARAGLGGHRHRRTASAPGSCHRGRGARGRRASSSTWATDETRPAPSPAGTRRGGSPTSSRTGPRCAGHDAAAVTPLATEFLVEAPSAVRASSRVVSSAFGTGADWEQEFFDEHGGRLAAVHRATCASTSPTSPGSGSRRSPRRPTCPPQSPSVHRGDARRARRRCRRAARRGPRRARPPSIASAPTISRCSSAMPVTSPSTRGPSATASRRLASRVTCSPPTPLPSSSGTSRRGPTGCGSCPSRPRRDRVVAPCSVERRAPVSPEEIR